MLTRIEIDGFKSFADFELDLPPFLVVLGQNASGKSNLFDAVQLLRRLVSAPSLFDAFADMRGELSELFRRYEGGDGVAQADRMTFAVEVLLEPDVVDPFGEVVDVSHTRLRYELTIGLHMDPDGFPRARVLTEAARPLLAKEDSWPSRAGVSKAFKEAKLRYKRTTELLTTGSNSQGNRVFKIAQEGSQGRRRQIPAHSAEATVLSSITSAAEFPLLFALRRELESWRFLQLDPAALRQPSTQEQRGDVLSANGANLAKVLRRIERTSRSAYGSGLDDIAAALAKVVRGFAGIEVEENAARGQWETYLTTRDEGRVSARVASDGTLRVLTLLAALHDPDHRGLICFEEPENGIYPQRLRELLGLLSRLVTDPTADSDQDEPLTQLILSSHSPVVLTALEPADLVVMDWTTRVSDSAGGRISRVRRVLPPPAGQQAFAFNDLPVMTVAERRDLPGIDVEEAKRVLES
ncbi:putative ATPase [Actinoalloteichus hoggarensis]|uniref:Chromosome partition protein Smc n=1 Tax=Actinoalloteichus hoggarensis TaxID=1470176 RepID=A0A221W8P4_9PSEU|nr:AAA family ATPase [Actinoalloteichus hoggarensis]ASO22390.1 Chromosome partition protein Smc [Actinoalloteichus hoggarensis]MBB5923187.1 putative ATPase [Actinoalloteichus hoggarensis]